MCEYSQKLVAWLDHELGDAERSELEHHFQTCLECRKQLGKYKQISDWFMVYRDAVAAARVRRDTSRWVPLFSGAAAIALAATIILLFVRPRIAPLPVQPAAAVAPPPAVLEVTPAPRTTPHVHRGHSPSHVQAHAANWPPTAPAIQIAIPADAVFPPGAVPEGVNFTADVSLGPDGSAQQIRLRPRLAGFERRASQP